MRKGKMQAKMMEMRVVAEQEMDDDEGIKVEHKTGDLVVAQTKFYLGKKEESSATRGTGNVDAASQQDLSVTRLRFVSTRTMGLMAFRLGDMGSTLSPRSLRSGVEDVPGIFDELDKGLEWSQDQCEHAALQFLRNGEWSMEIEKEKAKKEVQRLEGNEERNNLVALDAESKGE